MKRSTILFLCSFMLKAHAVSLPKNVSVEADPLSPKNIFNLHTGKKEIVLTIDDGPTPGVTEKILDFLKEEKISAAFFLIGAKAQSQIALVKRMEDEGHIIANHTFTHPILTTVISKDPNWKSVVHQEFFKTHDLLFPYLGHQREWYFRAPGGAWKKEIADVINSEPEGLKTLGPLYWDIGGEIKIQNGKYLSSADWDCWKKNITVANCLSGYVNETLKYKGGVVLFHDVNAKSAELIIQYIKEMQTINYRFVSLDQINF